MVAGRPPGANSRLHSRRDALRLGAVGLLGAALATACGSEPEPAAPAPAPATLALRARAPVPPGVTQSGRLTLGVLRSDAIGREPLAPVARALTYACLVAVDPRTAAVHGDVAQSIEVPQPQVVRLTLRPDVRFHPNSDALALPLTAEVVQREAERRRDEGEFLFSEVIERIEVIDLETLRIHLRGPFGLLFEMLGDPALAAIRGEGRYVDFPEEPGAGPFVPAGRERLGDVLVANPRYHFAGRPLLSEVVTLRFDRARDLDLAFAGGDLDTRAHPDEQSRELGAERDDIVAVERSSTGIVGLGLSLLPEKGGATVRHVVAFQDQRVRAAVSRALDRAAFTVAHGGRVAGPVGPAHVADALPAGELTSHPLYLHDPAEARALLSAAGHENLSFRIQVPDRAELREAAALITEQLRDGGFQPRLSLLEPARWDRALAAGDFEATLFDFAALETPDLGLRLHTTRGLAGDFSPWGYSNPVYDEAVRNALSALDPADRAERSREAQRLLLDDVPAMFPIWSRLERASIAKRVQGFEFAAYGFNASWLAAGWRVEDPAADG